MEKSVNLDPRKHITVVITCIIISFSPFLCAAFFWQQAKLDDYLLCFKEVLHFSALNDKLCIYM